MSKINIHNYEAYLLDFSEGNLSNEEKSDLFQFLNDNAYLVQGIDLSEMDLIQLNEFSLMNEKYKNKDLLKKDNNNWKEHLVISYLENQLNAKDKKLFESELEQDKKLEVLLEAFKKTKLTETDGKVTMPEKYKLLKPIIKGEDIVAFIDDELKGKEREDIKLLLSNSTAFESEVKSYEQTRIYPDFSIVFEAKNKLKREVEIVLFRPIARYLAIAASIALLCGLFFLYSAKPNFNSVAYLKKSDKIANAYKFPAKKSKEKESETAVNNIFVQISANQQFLAKNANKSICIANSGINPKKMSSEQTGHALNEIISKNDIAGSVATVIDTFLVPFNLEEDKNEIAGNKLNTENKINNSNVEDMYTDKALSPKEYIADKIIVSTWGKESPPNKSLTGLDILGFIAKKLNRNLTKKVNAEAKYNDDKEAMEYTFTLGSFSISSLQGNN